ncbi:MULTISPECIES: PIN/TRAM domain-containing protein [Crateriforma]
MAGASAVVLGDIYIPKKRIDTITAIYFGVLVGVLLTFILWIAMAPMLEQMVNGRAFQLVVGLVLVYVCTSLLLQTKDDFRFLIPYVEFVREVKGFKPLILDTSVVIDGRIADLVATGIFDNQLIMPRFALTELQAIADSSDKLRRTRGRRGLDVLNRLRADETVDLQIFDRELPEFAGQSVDLKLVLLAKHLEGKVVTGDFNLNKVAKLQGVPVINLNEISNSLRPVYLPDEVFRIRVIKPGEGPEQGIGYLDDGTMVVIEGGRKRIGQELQVRVTSTLQTNAGKMIFTRYDGDANRG